MRKIFYLLAAMACLTAACSKSDASSDDQATTPPPTTPTEPTEPTTPAKEENPTQTDVTTYDGYSLLWNDEFNTTSLNQSRWSYETGTGVNGDFGTGQLDRATSREQNVSILPSSTFDSDGALAITTRRENYMDRDYTSGRINTNTKFSCGPGTRIEARIWARDVKYKGQGFAFWMMPAEKPDNLDFIMWPQGGEVDIMEYVGAIPFYNLGTVHYAWSWENNTYQDWNHGHMGAYYSYAEGQQPATNPGYGGWPATDLTNAGAGAYHLYRVDWYNDRIEFSVDQHVYHINYFNDGAAFNNAADGQDASASLTADGKRMMKSEYSEHFDEWKSFEHKFYIILSAGVGGNDNLSYGGAITPEAKFPCTTLIDYIRVYKRN